MSGIARIMFGWKCGVRREGIGCMWIHGAYVLLFGASYEGNGISCQIPYGMCLFRSEAAVDKPLLYDQGWGKKQAFCM